MRCSVCLLALLLTTACNSAEVYIPDPPDPAYRAEIAAWQKKHSQGMKRDWGSLVGLFWLGEGENAFGSDPRNPVVLTKGKAPAGAGVFKLQSGAVTIDVAPGIFISLAGKPVRKATLRPDTSGDPDVLELGTLQMHVLERNGRYAIRVRDTSEAKVASFKDLEFFPVDERYRVRGRLVRTPQPVKIAHATENMGEQSFEAPGYVEFTLNGRDLRLYPSVSGERLFFVFKDQTSGKTTYPAARFLYADPKPEGEVVLDFNRAYSPPCAFTPYATCPLAARENTLPVAIEAGEKYTRH